MHQDPQNQEFIMKRVLCLEHSDCFVTHFVFPRQGQCTREWMGYNYFFLIPENLLDVHK